MILHAAVLLFSLQEFLAGSGSAPAAYVLSKTADHRVVIVGENHWQRADVELVGSLVPGLKEQGVALAMEVLHAANQKDIDALIAAEQWSEPLANSILRAAAWPYVQYRDILKAAWRAKLMVIALGPPEDWRKQGIGYDEFMAERVLAYAKDDQHRVLAYCGMHHAFTRFLQVERRRNGRATEFMDRFGNILWRRLAEDVFLIALHKPDPCGEGENVYGKLCAPLDGAIDCAAKQNGGKPVAFDILGSPISEAKFPATSFYAHNHPLLRLIDYADGYVWSGPVDAIARVDLIPLAELDPASANDAKKQAEWAGEAERLAHPKRPASAGACAPLQR